METMRKYIVPLLIIALATSFLLFKNYNSNKTSLVPENQQTGYEARVSLAIDFGNKEVKNFDTTIGIDDTAFSVLKNTVEKENINLETKQYDFGVFVKKIGEFESTAKKSWIYFVNGESGQIAADQYKLKNGDKVEWKYVLPK